MKKLISFEITSEGHVVAPITKNYSKMSNDEKLKLKKHLIFHSKMIKVKPVNIKKK